MKETTIYLNEAQEISKSIDSLAYQIHKDFKYYSAIKQTNSKESLIKGVSNDTVFTVFTTLFVFIIGVAINEIIKKVERLSERKKIRKYFKYHVDKIASTFSAKLIEAYKDYYQNASVDNGISRNPPKVLSNDFERIRKIESKELFHSIEQKTELSKILGQIDYFDKIMSEVNTFHEKAIIASDELRVKLSDQVNDYLNIMAEFTEYERNLNPTSFSTEPHYKYFNESILFFYHEIAGKRAITSLYRKIIRPNQQYLVKNELFRTHSIGRKLTEQGKDLSYTFNELKRMTVEVRLQYREFVVALEDSRRDLNENIRKIKWGK
jgi:hypothetical protein